MSSHEVNEKTKVSYARERLFRDCYDYGMDHFSLRRFFKRQDTEVMQDIEVLLAAHVNLVAENERLRELVQEVLAGYDAERGSDFDWPAWAEKARAALSTEPARRG